MSRRSGTTLLELLVVITVGTAVTGMAVGLLGLALHFRRETQSRLQATAAVERLDRQFREDCHAALDCQPLAAADGWSLALTGDAVVEYRFHPGRVERVERAGEKVRGRETFVLKKGAEGMIRLIPEGDARIACLELTGSEQVKPLVEARPVRIEAALGLDHRFSVETR